MFDKSKIKLSLNIVKKEDKDLRNWKLSDFITPKMRMDALKITQKTWSTSKILDQGSTGHCVGFGWAGFGISEPVEDTDWDNKMGDNIYYKAKEIDGEPGQENGSTTLSGVKAFTFFGKLDHYAFANTLDDIKVWLKTQGPVVVGTNWYNGMFDPSSNGVVSIAKYDSVAGGHEYIICGLNDDISMFTCTNSWGTEWANSGQFFISYKDMERLFSEDGDAVTAVEIPHDPEPPVPPEPNPDPNPVPPEPDPSGCITILAPILERIAVALEKIAKKRFHN